MPRHDVAYVWVEMDDGTERFMEFVTRGRSPSLPSGARWDRGDWWVREPADAAIFETLMKAFPAKDRDNIDQPRPLRYTKLEKAGFDEKKQKFKEK